MDEIVKQAAQAGAENPAGLYDMTPVQIELTLTALAARERRRMERMDEAAWLIGRYAAIGINAPGRYPRRPDVVRRLPESMSADEMKQALVSLAKRREDDI